MEFERENRSVGALENGAGVYNGSEIFQDYIILL
jgi:hypothetical protein